MLSQLSQLPRSAFDTAMLFSTHATTLAATLIAIATSIATSAVTFMVMLHVYRLPQDAGGKPVALDPAFSCTETYPDFPGDATPATKTDLPFGFGWMDERPFMSSSPTRRCSSPRPWHTPTSGLMRAASHQASVDRSISSNARRDTPPSSARRAASEPGTTQP